MKVGMLTSATEQCGIAVYSRDLAEGLRPLTELHVVPVWDGETLWEDYLCDSTARLNDCDVVHIQHEYSFWGSILPGQNRFFEHVSAIRRPIVLTAHTLGTVGEVLGLNLPGSLSKKLAKRMLAVLPSYRNKVERRTFDVADRIIVHDIPSAERLKPRGIDASKIRILPMGVPTPVLEPGLGDAFRSQYNLKGKRLIVIFGFIRPGRGYEAMLDILPDLNSDVMLIIAGGPQTQAHQIYLNMLKSEIESKHLQDRVVTAGYVFSEQVPGVMQAADIVLCSQEHGTGSYTLQVALGYGRSILASDLPCFTSLEETCGCLITYKRYNKDDLLSKLNLLLSDRSASERISQHALAYALENSWERVAERTLEVYKELAG